MIRHDLPHREVLEDPDGWRWFVGELNRQLEEIAHLLVLGRVGVPAAGTDGADGTTTTIWGVTFWDNVIPSGAKNGSNPDFTLPAAPNPPGSLIWVHNLATLLLGVHYTLSGNLVRITDTNHIPKSGSNLRCWFRSL